MFTKAGAVKVEVLDVKFSEPKFAKGPNDFDVCIQVSGVDDPSQVDWWRGEFSGNFGKGNFATKKQSEITMETLRKLGFEGSESELSTLKDVIVGKQTVAMIKETVKDDKTFYNIQYLGAGSGGNAPKEEDVITPDAVKARMAALFGSKADVMDANAPPAAAPKANPFGKTKSPF